MSDRRAQNAVRDQLVAAALAERPRRRRRTTVGIAVIAALLGATAVAEATGLLAMGEPIETLLPADESARVHKYQPPDGTTLVVSAPDPNSRYGWGVGVYTSREGLDCALAGQVLGSALGLERDGRFHPYGPGVIGSCGNLDRLPLMSDYVHAPGPHPRTILYGRVGTRPGPLVFQFKGKRYTPQVGNGGAFLLVFDGVIGPADVKLLP
ncbi:hypothetical protein OJ998_33945 [Solirubrobacter taibaiensis]|nr:hypothetical protein [Solirubrobacter taibaiensis]